MSRGAGFANADLDVNVARDAKFRRLARLHPDLIAQAFAGYIGMLAESWGSGERKAAIDAWPEIIPWSDEAIAALVEVELLDAEQKVQPKAWGEWFGAACARREKRRQAGSEGGKQKASNALARLEQQSSNASDVLQPDAQEKPSSNAVALLPQTPSKNLPVRPSVRSSKNDSPKPPQAGARPRVRRGKGQGPRQVRVGSAEIDARVLTHIADILPKPARTPLPEQIEAEEAYERDPERWIEQAKR